MATRNRNLFAVVILVTVAGPAHPQGHPSQQPTEETLITGDQGAAEHLIDTEAVPMWAAVEDLGYEDDSSGLFGLDVHSGKTTLVGETGERYLTDVTLTPQGDLFAIDLPFSFLGDSRLVLLNRHGAKTIVSWKLPIQSNALTSDKKGRLFLVSLEGILYRIDRDITRIFELGPLGNGLVPSGDLTFSQNSRNLYGTVRWRGDTDALVKISKKNGAAIVVGEIGYPQVYGLSFAPNGHLYGVAHGESSPVVITINPRTGRGKQLTRASLRTAGGMAARILRAPVEGKLRVTGVGNPRCENHPTKWTFCQHQSGLHRPGDGVANSDETYAWDINLSRDADAGRPVFPVAPGVVVRYGGQTPPGSSSGAVLIKHEAGSATWYSGYLHMQDIRVKEGQRVSHKTVLGHIGNVGATTNSHLHFVVYVGDNTPSGLQSVDAVFFRR